MRKIKPITGLNEIFVNRQCKKIGPYISKQNSNYFFEETLECVHSINSKGYYKFINRIDESKVEFIKSQVQNLKCYDPYNRIKDFNLSTVPEETHVANFYGHDLMQIPEIAEIASDPLILNIASEFLGCKPTLSSVNMWKSLEGRENAQAAQNFHRDVDDYKFIKVFVYLSDVDMESGPHVYVESSSQSKEFRRVGRFRDDEIESVFGKEKVKYFTEPCGSVFMVDTFGIHKGLLPKGKNRLLLQFEYSINPILAYNYIKVRPALKEFDPYIFRLYY